MGKRSRYKTRKDGLKETTRTYIHFGLRDFSGLKHFYGRTDDEIDRKIAAFEQEQNRPSFADFSALVDAWWDKKETSLSPNSISSYKAKKEEIKSYFGSCSVQDLTPQMIITWLNRISAQGYSQRSISDRKCVLKNILDFALAEGIIQANPCNNLPVIKGKAKQKRDPATEADLDKLERHKTDSMIARFYYFLEYTGCRIGEALVLQEKDVDRKNHKAKIYKDVAWLGNIPTVKMRPKTAAGNREIDLYDNVLEILPQHDNPEAFLFFPNGLPHKSALQKQQIKFRESIGITSTAHQLRHSYASIMHSAEMDVKDTQARLGHANIAVTQDIYTSIERSHNEKARNKANEYILNERLGRDKKRCPHCGSIYLSAEDGHQFKFCPDCGTEIVKIIV